MNCGSARSHGICPPTLTRASTLSFIPPAELCLGSNDEHVQSLLGELARRVRVRVHGLHLMKATSPDDSRNDSTTVSPFIVDRLVNRMAFSRSPVVGLVIVRSVPLVMRAEGGGNESAGKPSRMLPRVRPPGASELSTKFW